MGQADVLSKVIGPAAGLLLVAGILLVEELGLSYTTPWVLIGLIGFAASMIIGAGYGGREGKRIEASSTSKDLTRKTWRRG